FAKIEYSYCNDCHVDIQFMGNEYSFEENQIDFSPSGFVWNSEATNIISTTENAFFEINIVSPATPEVLINNVGVKTPLLQRQSLANLQNDVPPPVSAAFSIFNYCKDFFEASGDDNESYNLITDAELLQSYEVQIGEDELSLHPYNRSLFNCSGELQGKFIINGETQIVTANYKLNMEILERL
ncbi:hypothetical protein, partial [Fulvivirga lutimaris]|uniref:hypothetical protein n=1 Tax=Fulvivirga lutimaris TaxID=1819566 RepID=UPI0016245A3A